MINTTKMSVKIQGENLTPTIFSTPIQVAARSKAWVFGRSLAGITGSNPAGGMDVCLCLLRVLCVGLITLHTSPTKCGLCECDREASTMRGPRTLGTSGLHNAHLFLRLPHLFYIWNYNGRRSL